MRYRMKSNLLESAFRSSAVVGFLLLYSSQFLPQGLSFQNAFLYNFTELQRTFFSSKVLFGSFVGNFPKGSKKLANLNGLCKQSFLQNTVWTVNDVLVDPYPFFWSIHTLFTALKGYGTTKTKKKYGSTKTSLTVHTVCVILRIISRWIVKFNFKVRVFSEGQKI